MPESNDEMVRLVEMLANELGRLPTEDEVMAFIYGTNDVRKSILQSEG